MRIEFYDRENLERFYDLQDYVIRNLDCYIKESSFHNPEAEYLSLHLKYLKRVREVFGLNLDKIYVFYTSIVLKKFCYFKSSGVPPRIRYQVRKRYGRDTCAITGETSGYICHHRIIYDENELKVNVDVSNIIPIEENVMFALEDTKHILVRHIMPLINTFVKHYPKRPWIVKYDNTLCYFMRMGNRV